MTVDDTWARLAADHGRPVAAHRALVDAQDRLGRTERPNVLPADVAQLQALARLQGDEIHRLARELVNVKFDANRYSADLERRLSMSAEAGRLQAEANRQAAEFSKLLVDELKRLSERIAALERRR